MAPIQGSVTWLKRAPVAAGGLLEEAGLLVGQRAAAVDLAHLLEQLVLLHGARGRIDQRRLLRGRRHRDGDHRQQRERADDEPDAREE